KIKYSGTRIRNSARNNAGTRSPLDISSCLFVRNAGIKVIENDKVNIEKQPIDDCFFYSCIFIFCYFHLYSLTCRLKFFYITGRGNHRMNVYFPVSEQP
ncbi:hypothetical protein NU319_25345, partial [Escherichia coli]|nr:hypothetical protein [Escherichia coli]